MIGECKECHEVFGGLGLTSTELCPNCNSLTLMESPKSELQPFSIHILDNDSLRLVAQYETWQFTTDENLTSEHKYPIITLQFPIDGIEEVDNG